MAENTFEQVKEIIVDLLGVDESKVTLEARFREDLEADSLDLVGLIMAFEDKFGGEISSIKAGQDFPCLFKIRLPPIVRMRVFLYAGY